MAVFTLLGGVIAQNQQGARAPIAGAFAAVAAVVIVPLFYGLAGFIGGIITAALFNFGAGLTGGLEIETGQ